LAKVKKFNNPSCKWKLLTIGGGAYNEIPGIAATIAGGNGNRASGDYGAIGGGSSNTAGELGTVAGGTLNDAGPRSTVGGGTDNDATASYSTIGGGQYNRATVGTYATVAGGQSNIASGQYATIGGGGVNYAINYAATVGGGQQNNANGDSSIIAGGGYNTADGANATIGGGFFNRTNGPLATIGGGAYNIVEGSYATVGGGLSCRAAGYISVASGFQSNSVLYGQYAHASGMFGERGDAQYVRYTLRNSTLSTNSPTQLYLDGSSQPITLQSGYTYSLNFKIIGSKDDGTTISEYNKRAILRNVSGTLSAVNVVDITTPYEGNTNTDATITVGGGAVNVSVTGITNENWRWVAVVDGIEMKYSA